VCTVAWVPTEDGGYRVGHNRDESRRRGRAKPPTRRSAGPRAFLAPTDADAGGTWITVNDAGLTVCILNAAHRAPDRLPATPESRGALPLDLAECATLEEIHARLSGWDNRLATMRAFHLVALARGSKGRPARAERHRWDGVEHVVDRLNPPGLFVSALLDQSGAERARGRSWRDFLAAHPGRVDTGDLAAWLANHEPERGMLSACVHRPDARTVSRTMVDVPARGSVTVRYLDGSPCAPDGPETVHRLD
jgi:hypothetical protein